MTCIKNVSDLVKFNISFPVIRKFMLASNKTLTEDSVTWLILKGDVTKRVTSTSFRDRLRSRFNTGTNIQVWGRKDSACFA